ncbi:MAG: hypothetical protein sL5_10740 [Candidatus Mesenet longicola]|uniref:Uncharacterized protein n=1 Tax=Candidatus Mesenet longicola TaxID=1892558 RepID=A0A8J3HQM5_9RICK|nr:MAG: hypothetical protein sGL2_11130 [Candidatus Mesenet longicola]GHM60081.1 MAG: hypothetical protein sL5_10740 [Candidatus Mesenet longicola]
MIQNAISSILDKITGGIEKTSFHIKDVLICGKIINELQVQNSIAKDDDALEVPKNMQNTELSQATVSCGGSKGTKLQSNL